VRFPYAVTPQNDDERFMFEALKQAWLAYEKEEVPVGAVMVYEGQVIARGHNQVEMLQDATAHAEMLCITAAENYFENWRLKGATLYSTLEPCAMCAGACFLSRVDKIVWAAPDIRHGACGSWVNLFSSQHPTHNPQIISGVLEEIAASLMRRFFVEQREKKEQKIQRELLN
jgi:tRNA(adenine34) deaminase